MPAKSKPSESSDMRNYSCSGKHIKSDIASELAHKGFIPSAKVFSMRSKDSTECLEITGVGEGVTLKRTNGKDVTEVSAADLLSHYDMYREECCAKRLCSGFSREC